MELLGGKKGETQRTNERINDQVFPSSVGSGLLSENPLRWFRDVDSSAVGRSWGIWIFIFVSKKKGYNVGKNRDGLQLLRWVYLQVEHFSRGDFWRIDQRRRPRRKSALGWWRRAYNTRPLRRQSNVAVLPFIKACMHSMLKVFRERNVQFLLLLAEHGDCWRSTATNKSVSQWETSRL